MKTIMTFLKSEDGVTSVEYGVLAAGLAVAIGGLVAQDGLLDESMKAIFSKIVSSVPTTTPTQPGG